MSDEDLRALERAARTDVPSLLRYARALERAGRSEEALAALLGRCGDADVRREVGRFPIPCLRGPGEGGTGYTDVAPLVVPPAAGGAPTAPRVLWEAETAGTLLVSPLGVVVDEEDVLDDPYVGLPASVRRVTRLLDPATGAVRAEIEGFAGFGGWIAGDVLLLQPRQPDLPASTAPAPAVAAFDLWDGRPLWRADLGAGARVAAFARDALYVLDPWERLHACPLPDPRRPPGPLAPVLVPGAALAEVLSVGPDLLAATALVAGLRESVVVRRATGELLWRGPGRVVVDAAGWVLTRSDGLVCHDADGRERWRLATAALGAPDERQQGDVLDVHLAPHLVVARVRGASAHDPRLAPTARRLVAVDRATGQPRELGRDVGDWGALALARGVVYVGRGGAVMALGGGGEVLWRFTPTPGELLFLPLDGRLLCAVGDTFSWRPRVVALG